MHGSRVTAATPTPPSGEACGSGLACPNPDGPNGQSVPVLPSNGPAATVAVAYSGGRDSTALLHATLQAAAQTRLTVCALHVHHGLSRHADDWLAHCEHQCRGWAEAGLPVRFKAERLGLQPATGESIEAAARTARYEALRCMAVECGADAVLLAHHRRDQAETLLLQALRGAGVAGLAAMPGSIERDGLTWVRPWLEQPRSAIEAYVLAHRLRHIEDDSNADPRFARNRLRLAVWPALCEAFPQAETTLADAAAWAQQASACAADLAAIDLAGCSKGPALELAAWERLPSYRACNALRAWLRKASGQSPSAAEVERLMRELPAAAAPARWSLQAGGLRRYRGRLAFEPLPIAGAKVCRESSVSLHRAGRYPLPGWGGVLVALRAGEGGVALARLARLELAPRSGGEQFQGAPGRPPRSLKKQFQAAALPAWAREGPLLLNAGQLVFVPGLGIDARVIAAPGEPQLVLRWETAGSP
ncbi:MAG: tRNA lysidine(34) synthetase TilS [Methylibium sp.]|nr:tRNA lysidine(34) synthetase TilS [Methylibium sp.]